MKKMFNKMSNTVKTMTCKAHCAMTCARAHLSAPLCNTRGEGYIDTAIKILIAVVLGACSWLASTLCSGTPSCPP